MYETCFYNYCVLKKKDVYKFKLNKIFNNLYEYIFRNNLISLNFIFINKFNTAIQIGHKLFLITLPFINFCFIFIYKLIIKRVVSLMMRN